MLPLAAKIIELVFETAIATGATQATEGAIAQGKVLWQKIKARFQGQPQLQQALEESEKQQSQAILEAEILTPLAEEMQRDRDFAEEIEALYREIEQLRQEGDKISITGTSHDDSTLKMVGKIEAKEVNF
jgi:predicted acetyltransferase